MSGFIGAVLLFLAFAGLTLLLVTVIMGKRNVYFISTTATLCAWFVGLILDANIDLEPAGFLAFRILLPLLAMGLCILHTIVKSRSD